jgi:TldD protein
MNDAATLLSDDWFFEHSGMERARVQRQVDAALAEMEDGELFLEYAQSENLLFDDGRIRSASFDTEQGFGLRSVYDETSAFAHSSLLNEEAIARAGQTVRSLARHGGAGVRTLNLAPNRTPVPLYGNFNPLLDEEFSEKVALVSEIDAYLRAREPLLRQATISLAGEWQIIEVLRSGGARAMDVRPLVRLNISVVLERDGRMETGSSGSGGRMPYRAYCAPEQWKAQAEEALRQARGNLESRPAPAGEFPVVLGPGWPGVLLHEAVGHGLEGDFNRKGSSTFAGRIGERVAAPGVTVVDDGTLPGLRGSLTVDDEGTPTSRTVLIEDGILKCYLQDRMNARLMGAAPTGNGRRESYASPPLPRMTNTFMLAGTEDPKSLVSSLKRGVYAVNFGGGSVDITSGKFVFSASEAYWVENGEIQYPLKGATLIGSGPEVMQRIRAVGNDLALDPGIGTCGKDGQSVPVGVGQPSLLIEKITVGGTEAA